MITKLTHTKFSKIAALVAGFALVLTSFAPAARAQSTAEIQAQIAALLAQVAALQAQLGGGTTVAAPFTRDLTIGSQGADVTSLQNWLISNGYTIPAGATGYFGTQTQAAVARYQAANAISPAAGYFGPITRTHINAKLVVTPPAPTPDDDDDDRDELRGGEASLERLRARSSDDRVEERQAAEIAEFTFDVRDGDVRIDRLDLTFSSAAGNGEDEPWDAFDTVRILDENGDELAEADVSDEDDWLRDDEPYVFRFTNLDYVVREGDRGTFIVEVTAQNGVLDSGDTDEWTVFIDDRGIRGTDAAGIQQYLGDDGQTVRFDIVEEGDAEELHVRRADNDPKASVLKIEDNGRSDWHTIFAFDLEAEDEDIELDQAVIELELTTANASDAINGLELVIDGKRVNDWRYETNGNAATVNVIFDIDGDVTIDEGDTVTAELRARFNSEGTGTFDSGDRIRARVAADGITGEGRDDVESRGTASGSTHTLSLTAVEVTDITSSTARSESGSTGTVSFEFTLEAEDGDVRFDMSDIDYAVLGPDASIASAQLARISGDASFDGGTSTWTVKEGDDATFMLDVTLTTVDSGDNGNYRVRLENVVGVEIDRTSNPVFLTN